MAEQNQPIRPSLSSYIHFRRASLSRPFRCVTYRSSTREKSKQIKEIKEIRILVQLTASMAEALSELLNAASAISTSPGSTSSALESSGQNSVVPRQDAAGQSLLDFGRVDMRVAQGRVDVTGPKRDELRAWDDSVRDSLLSHLATQPETTESRATAAALRATPLRSEAPFLVLAEESGTTPPRKSPVVILGFKCSACLTLSIGAVAAQESDMLVCSKCNEYCNHVRLWLVRTSHELVLRSEEARMRNLLLAERTISRLDLQCLSPVAKSGLSRFGMINPRSRMLFAVVCEKCNTPLKPGESDSASTQCPSCQSFVSTPARRYTIEPGKIIPPALVTEFAITTPTKLDLFFVNLNLSPQLLNIQSQRWLTGHFRRIRWRWLLKLTRLRLAG